MNWGDYFRRPVLGRLSALGWWFTAWGCATRTWWLAIVAVFVAALGTRFEP